MVVVVAGVVVVVVAMVVVMVAGDDADTGKSECASCLDPQMTIRHSTDTRSTLLGC